MQVFFAPDINDNSYRLDERESKHVVKVMRSRQGDNVKLIDGKGNLYDGVISNADFKCCEIKIVSKIEAFEKRDYQLHIAISPLKNPDRLEWFIEKSVEIGVNEITPLICKNTEKSSIRDERLRGIIISAMKQSLKAYDTILHQPCTFEEFINSNHDDIQMIAHCNTSFSRQRIADVYTCKQSATILIGPEGDFSEKEIVAATNAGYIPVQLGSSRLRTETAGVAACHSIYFMNI